ncbi:DUF1615 domain-containing protein [Corallococcus sp. H22C18031201]|nr:DUF1615 domain-containing protein [Corallococcus sp. H22C18031201]
MTATRRIRRAPGTWVSLLGLLSALGACAPRHEVALPSVPPPPLLTAAQVAGLIPSTVKDREGWAADVLAALEAEALPPSPPAICSVLAIIEQESGFQADPAVPGLAKLVRQRLETEAGRLGPLGKRLLAEVLAARAPGQTRTFDARLSTLRTERDLDRLFRDMLAYGEQTYPKTFAAADLASSLLRAQKLEDLNPITTAGAMQVSVQYAQEKAGEDADPVAVRESLYTRAGGVRYGTARLLGFEAAYPEPVFRFADYNAGIYASRNAALQSQVSQLTGLSLAADGDLQLYDKQGEPRSEDSQSLRALLVFRQRFAPDLSERQVRRDVRTEKTLDLEATDTWRAVKRAAARRTGETPAYAQLPEVTLKSPKLRTERTTAWFARSVDTRYQKCLARYHARERAGPP